MRRTGFIILTVMALLAVTFIPAFAVTYGQPDEDGHPYVGLVSFHNSQGVPLWRCTGTLISPTIFLTAAHCTEAPAVKAVIWFDSGYPVPISIGTWGGSGTSCSGKTGYPCTGDVTGTPVPHPGWTGALTLPNTHDVGVVLLDAPVTDKGYGALPPAGYLDALATKRGPDYPIFQTVGYGLQGVVPIFSALRTRYVGTVNLVELRSALSDGYNLHYSSNAGIGLGGSGGTCFGDSGGPVFVYGTNTIVAVNSFVLNTNCKGAGFGYRVDTDSARSFLGGYIALP